MFGWMIASTLSISVHIEIEPLNYII